MSESNTTNSDASATCDNTTSERPRHDELFKKVMSEPVAAREFLEYYLPVTFKSKIDLSSVKIEKESFVTEDLRKRHSDVIYSVSLKDDQMRKDSADSASTNIDDIAYIDNDKAYVYVLIEHQSSSDYWMAFRLWQYMLLLCERHKDANKNKGNISKKHNSSNSTQYKQEKDNKLPLICPIVVYANDKPYNAPVNL